MTLEYKTRIEPSFVDKRGTITNVLEAPIEHVAFITSRKGSVRGNHYHVFETQYVYVIRGAFIAYSKDVTDPQGPTGRLEVVAGELLVTPPNVAHRHVYLKDTWLLNMDTAPRKRLEHEDTFAFAQFKVEV